MTREKPSIDLIRLDLPDFGEPDRPPEIPADVYRSRLRRVRARMCEERLDALLVYADREHSANLAYCIGFDPRFEEALLVLTAEGGVSLCLGNECIGIASNLPVETDLLLCQEFSLMGQDRSISWDLAPLLKQAGLRVGMRCGIAGWKRLMADRLEVPAYIVDLTAGICGTRPRNANDLFMHPRMGLRIVNEPEQIACFEYAATRTSRVVRQILERVQPGQPCHALAGLFDSGGLPLSCHPMLACGDPIRNGMASPGNDVIREGQFFTCAMGVWGGLTARAGLLAADPAAFGDGPNARVFDLIDNYLRVVRAWYGALGVSVPAGEVWAAAESARDAALFTFCVNPGHYLHLDEWVSSPFQRQAASSLPSGCAIQADIIPVARDGRTSVNMEDGIILADAGLRTELARRYPALYDRCQARRRFMTETLGYQIGPDVLPLGNLPGVYFPCLLNTEWVCRFE